MSESRTEHNAKRMHGDPLATSSALIVSGERMSVQEARTWGGAADILVTQGGSARTDHDMVQVYIRAMSALWLQERALRIELAALRGRSASMPLAREIAS